MSQLHPRLTPEIQVNETLIATDPPFAKLLKAQQRLVWDITVSLLSLLGALAVARDEILEAIAADQTVLRFIFRLVSTASIPPEVFEEALTCLMILSEDNLPFGQAITDDQETRCYEELLRLKAAGGPRAVLACGVLHNIYTSLQWLDHSPGKDGACDAILVPSLSQALEQLSPNSGAKTNGHGASDHAGIVQVALEILAAIATDVQDAIEKGNRAPAEEWNGIDESKDADGDDAMEVDGSDKEDDDEDAEDKDAEADEDSDDEADSELLDADMGRVTGVDEDVPEGEGLNALPTVRELIQFAVPQLIRLTNIPVEHEEDMAIQAHAFSALNNLAWTMSCIDFSGDENANIFDAWAPAAKKIWLQTITPVLNSDDADLGLATLVTGLAWAVSRSLNGNTPSDGAQQRKFMALYQAAKSQGAADDDHTEGEDEHGHHGCDCDGHDDPLQGLGVKCIGVLGSLARPPVSNEVNREVGVFLMTLLGQEDTPIADAIEALDQIYEIYGDEEAACDKDVFWKDGFLNHLQELQPRLKGLAKKIDKRKQEELRNKADEAVLNLARFISYKKKHAPR